MKFKDLPPSERLKILRSEGGYVAWMREQARSKAANPGQQDEDTAGMVTHSVAVPAAAIKVLEQVGRALRSGDPSMLSGAALALRNWRP